MNQPLNNFVQKIMQTASFWTAEVVYLETYGDLAKIKISKKGSTSFEFTLNNSISEEELKVEMGNELYKILGKEFLN